MASGTDAKFDQGRCQTQGTLTPPAIGNGMKRPVGPAGGKCGVFTPPIPRLHKNGGKVRFGNPTAHVRTEADCESLISVMLFRRER